MTRAWTYTETPDLPRLRQLLTDAVAATGDDYDVSTQLVRLVERQREEYARARRRRRYHRAILLAAAALVLVLSGVLVLVQPHPPWSRLPPAKDVTVTGLAPGSWRATIEHLHRNPPGGFTERVPVTVTVEPGRTSGTLRLPDIAEPIPVRYRTTGSGLAIEVDPGLCASRLVVRLDGSLRGDTFTVESATAGSCYSYAGMAAELTGATFTRQRSP